MVTAKRSLSQNFLIDSAVISDILRACAPSSNDALIEVGAGQGAISNGLCQKSQSLTLIELDDRLLPVLQQRFTQYPHVKVLHQNALNFNYLSHQPQPYRLVANLPYHLSTILLQKFLQAHTVIQDMHLMLQKEVAQRICANQGSHRSWLSVLRELVFDAEMLFDIDAESFSPIPKIKSTFIRLSAKKSTDTPIDTNYWKIFLLQAFHNKRKNLRNNFKNSLNDSDWKKLPFNPQLRAEQLDLSQFKALYQQWHTCSF